MSTETIEQPTEVVIDTPVEEKKPTGSSLFDSLNIVRDPLKELVEQKPEDVKVEIATQVEVKGKTDDTLKLDPAPELKGKARENFARLETAKKEAEDRAAKIQADYDAAQTRLKELEAKANSINVTEYEEREKKLQQELAEVRGQFKTVALERDPEFIAKYEEPRQTIFGNLKAMAVAAGVTEADFARSVGTPEKLWEIRESLQPWEQHKWDAALTQMEQISVQRDLALKNRDQTIKEIEQRRNEEANQFYQKRVQENISIARKVAMEPFEKIEAFKDDEELKAQVTSTLEAIAGGKGAENWTPDQIMRHVAASVVQQKILTKQNELIESGAAEVKTRDEKIAELETKLKEREEFIQSRYGSIPNNDVPSGSKVEARSDRPIWEEIRVQL